MARETSVSLRAMTILRWLVIAIIVLPILFWKHGGEDDKA